LIIVLRISAALLVMPIGPLRPASRWRIRQIYDMANFDSTA
jgi:hypothetical protein